MARCALSFAQPVLHAARTFCATFADTDAPRLTFGLTGCAHAQYLGDLEEAAAPEVDISAWEQQRENWERFVRMDTVMPLVQKRFDEKGKLPTEVMLALTQGVDAAWARVKESALNRAVTSALLLTVAFDGVLSQYGGDNLDRDNLLHVVLDAVSFFLGALSILCFLANILFTVWFIDKWNEHFHCDADYIAYHITYDFDMQQKIHGEMLPMVIGIAGMLLSLLCRLPLMCVDALPSLISVYALLPPALMWILTKVVPIIPAIDRSIWGDKAFLSAQKVNASRFKLDVQVLLDHYHERAAHAKRMFAKGRASLSDGAGPDASSAKSRASAKRVKPLGL